MFDPFQRGSSYADWLSGHGHFSHGIELLDLLADGAHGFQRGQFLLTRSAFSIAIGCPESTSDRVTEAIKIFRKGAAFSITHKLGYAKSLATRGILRASSESASMAVSDFTEAIKCFESAQRQRALTLSNGGSGLSADIARTQMNRGLAYKDLGMVTEAREDFNKAEELLQSRALSARPDSESLLADVRLNRGVLFASLEFHDLAINDLESSLDLRERMLREGRLKDGLWVAYVRGMLGLAKWESGDRECGARLLDACVNELQSFRDAGRADVTRPLAVSRMNRASVCLQRGQLETAKTDIDVSISILENGVRSGARHLEGTLARARMIASEVLLRLDDVAASRDQRRMSLEAALDLMKRYPDESDARVMFMRNATSAVRYLIDTDPQEAIDICSSLAEALRRSVSGSESTEATRIMSRSQLQSLQGLLPQLRDAGFDVSQFPLLPSENDEQSDTLE
jgi:tetratricopeptide (TPR) repeat protein